MSLKVSFITINYNSSNYTIKLIESIEKYTTLEYEIVIVDNDSREEDYSNLKKYINSNQKIQLIRNTINEGFSSGNMLGVQYARGEYFFFINNDTQLLNDATLVMTNYLHSNLHIALATAKVNDENGNFSSSYKLFPSVVKELFGNSIARTFSKHNFPSNKIKLDVPTLVEVVSGSCMFFRARDFVEIGGFDKEFFLYCEEEDLSKRVWDYGKEVVFLPEAQIFHHSGGSTTKSFEIEREYYISYNILINKHFNKPSVFILKLLLILKLFRRSFKRKNGLKLFLCVLNGCTKNLSLRTLQH
ncbi:glycosyltransferase family 2 protein [Candidatus Sulfurimonas baltica]|uniref:Glycosyltransferase family 2 protein n=1 Tax=Candidatus Sulfurimonas baltica TaxID=2740404 RepID=A0A7S7LTX5_9BACT|nr:glycosyltransferase family 2 protein [Candidatus Sulfurimonas baltica]QOY51421.1 glycosyltransferase family 2 protein [Candidatus Sulfurimonas baltica]